MLAFKITITHLKSDLVQYTKSTLKSLMKSTAGRQTSSRKNSKLLQTNTCLSLILLSNL